MNSKYEGSCVDPLLHAPIYRNFYMYYVRSKKKKFKHLDVKRLVRVCALTDLSRDPCTAAETIARTIACKLRMTMRI